jgi:hypothetical protein
MRTSRLQTLSVKVSRSTTRRLAEVARRRGTTPSLLLRQAVERVVAGESEPGRGATLFDRNRDLLARLGRGPRDLSTNKTGLADLGQ